MRPTWLLIGTALAALAAGCGRDAAQPDPPRSSHASSATPMPSQTTPGQSRRRAAPAAQTRVIRAWSDTLRGGDEVGAARYFAVPSIVQTEPGGQPYTITHRAQAVAFQAVLPCGGRLLRAERDGRYVNALFRLTMRPGATCDAPGATARTDFVIRNGKIAEWRRAADEPGDDGGGDGGGGGSAAAAAASA